jgi:Tfp pilus assembly protein PilF
MDRIGKLEDLLDKQPGDSFLQHALALEYIKRGDDVKARELFEQILKNEPSYTGSYYHLAKLLERTGDTGHAIEIYRMGMEQALVAADHKNYQELKAAYDELTL